MNPGKDNYAEIENRIDIIEKMPCEMSGQGKRVSASLIRLPDNC